MNGYKFDLAISATISAAVVEEMIRKVVEMQTGRKVDTIAFKTRESGGNFNVSPVTVFDGCLVTFANDQPKPQSYNYYDPYDR